MSAPLTPRDEFAKWLLGDPAAVDEPPPGPRAPRPDLSQGRGQTVPAQSGAAAFEQMLHALAGRYTGSDGGWVTL